MLLNTALDVTDVAAPLHGDLSADLTIGGTVAVHNQDAALPIYVGGPDVTAADGWPINAGEAQSFDLSGGEVLHAVTDAGGVVAVRVLATGA